MKKSLIAILALVLSCVMLFAACGDKTEDKDADKAEETTAAVSDETTAPAEEDTTAAPVEEDTTAATEPSAPAVETPATSVGVKTYSMGSEEEGEIVMVAFLYDENGNVTEFMYGIAADTSVSDTSVEEIENVMVTMESTFNQLKSLGANVNASYENDGTEYYFEAEMIVASEIEATFVAEMFGVENNGAIIKAADLEAAAIAEGFTEYTEF